MKLIRVLRELLYPQRAVCQGCGRPLLDGLLCDACLAVLEARRLSGRLCGVCGSILEEDGACRLCRRGYGLQGRSVWQHRDVPRTLVTTLKHQGQREAALVLAAGMADTARQVLGDAEAVIAWAPMPPSRMRDRYFDHAQLLAQALGEELELPVRPLLRRVEGRKSIAHQVGLNAAERSMNLLGTFVCTEDVSGMTVLLVDDVLTTGATLGECSRCLRMAGAEVRFITATRA